MGSQERFRLISSRESVDRHSRMQIGIKRKAVESLERLFLETDSEQIQTLVNGFKSVRGDLGLIIFVSKTDQEGKPEEVELKETKEGKTIGKAGVTALRIVIGTFFEDQSLAPRRIMNELDKGNPVLFSDIEEKTVHVPLSRQRIKRMEHAKEALDITQEARKIIHQVVGRLKTGGEIMAKGVIDPTTKTFEAVEFEGIGKIDSVDFALTIIRTFKSGRKSKWLKSIMEQIEKGGLVSFRRTEIF